MEEKTIKKARYERSHILEIIKQVEEGVSQSVLREKYALGKCTLGNWLKKFGSEQYHQNKRREYSTREKKSIVMAISQGRMTVKEACIAYQIRSEKSVREWLRKFSNETSSFTLPKLTDMAKKKKVSEIKTSSEALEKALQEAQLKIIALNTMIDVAEEQLKIDIRKKFGAKPSLD